MNRLLKSLPIMLAIGTFSTAANAIDVVVEVEDFLQTGGAFNGFNTYVAPSGAGGINFNQSGDWGEYTFDIPTNGDYELRIFTGTVVSGTNARVTIDGQHILSAAMPNTGGWNTFSATTLGHDISLSAGTHTLKLESFGSPSTWEWNADRLEFTRVSEPPQNEPPAAINDEVSGIEGHAIITDVLSNDTDPNNGDTLFVSHVAGMLEVMPENGFVSVNTAGHIEYTPNVGFVGRDLILYTVSDGELTSTATLTIIIESAPEVTPIIIQAEDFLSSQGTRDSNGDGTPEGFLTYQLSGGVGAVNFVQSGDSALYSLNIPQTGVYQISALTGTPQNSAGLHVSFEGVDGSLLGSVPNTNGWDNFIEWPVGELSLTSGTHTMRIEATGSPSTWEWNGERFILELVSDLPAADFDSDGLSGTEDSCPESEGPISNAGCPVSNMVINRLDTLLLNNTAILSASDLTLRAAFEQLAEQDADLNNTGFDLFRQFWDTQNTETSSRWDDNPFHCELFNGVTPDCDRLATGFVGMTDPSVMDLFDTLAVINRFDTRSDNWQDCGEARVSFGLNRTQTIFTRASRLFVIFEARLPNPTPGIAEGCRDVVDFWTGLSGSASVEQKAKAINAMFLEGLPSGRAPVITFEHFTESTGQIRTNQFVQPVVPPMSTRPIFRGWMLREYKLVKLCDDCQVLAKPVSAKDAPNNRLFRPANTDLAIEFQDSFINNFMENLTGNTFASLDRNPMDEKFLLLNSQSQEPNLSASANATFASSASSDFKDRIDDALAGRVDVRGNLLTATQILNRAAGLSCGGCHNPNLLAGDDSIGFVSLPDGSSINKWPSVADFVHISEDSTLSDGLMNVFLPVREDDFETVRDTIEN